MAGPDDQDKLAENWNPAGGPGDAIATDWAAMLEADPGKGTASVATDRVLNQDEIDRTNGLVDLPF